MTGVSRAPTDDAVAEAGAVATAVARADRALRAHAGGLDLVEIRDGEAVVRFTGMCTGCAFKPMTMAATVEPMLTAVPGVTSVGAAGGRADPVAMERARRFLDG